MAYLGEIAVRTLLRLPVAHHMVRLTKLDAPTAKHFSSGEKEKSKLITTPTMPKSILGALETH
jgi:hypothetical protein